jgi:hypothetical protein
VAPVNAGALRGGALLPAALFAASLALLVAGAPTAFVWFDQLRHWGQSFEQIRGGIWIPPRGASVTGVGANGPLYHLILMAGLRVLASETAMAVYSAGTAAMGLAAAARLAARRWGAATALWPLAVVASHPILAEWMRVGLDHSFLPLWLPFGLAAWLLVERRRASVWAWIVWGLACGAGLQLHFTIGPALALASLFVWRPRQAPWAPFATLAGAALTYATMFGGAAVQSPGLTWHEAPVTAVRLIRAALSAPALRAAGVGWDSAWWSAPVAILGVAALVGALIGPRRRVLRWGLAVVAASLLLVSFDEASHYHHLMHLDIFLITLTAAGATVLAAFRPGRTLLTLLVFVHLLLGVQMVADARQRGIVELPSSYPLAWPDTRELAATAAQRDALATALAEVGLDHPVLRTEAVFGDVLPFFEHGWMFLRDHRSPPSDGAAQQAAWQLSPPPCRPGDRPAGTLCLRSAQAGPLRVASSKDSDYIAQTALKGQMWRQGLSFPPEMAQLDLVRSRNLPLRAVAPETQAFSRLVLRTFRFPLAIDLVGRHPVQPAGLGPPDRTRDGYVVREDVWLFADPLTSVEVQATGGALLVAFSLEFDLVQH